MWVAESRANEMPKGGGEESQPSQDKSSVVFLLPIKQILQIVDEGRLVEDALLGQGVEIEWICQGLHKLEFELETLAIFDSLLVSAFLHGIYHGCGLRWAENLLRPACHGRGRSGQKIRKVRLAPNCEITFNTSALLTTGMVIVFSTKRERVLPLSFSRDVL